ncbi:Spore germination YpeB [Acididesulfobacillus acetoxydans]|uniref:Spore germination YpeB n=1 Tax=Acididesulfobacillus acetoxydans TaxID=1561005 RepID=A0A8S0WE16_9FIRM|nr:PepSY1/2 domain-containing protein [Acididesulfobacillus acetoxydans]CAA7599762.1 Spore germination YpeB [Acididesulfobacillus acetoxydans]CEJ07329.1 YpeB sporulation [Acididesulfobacillus acetoxydans]
MRDRMRKAWLGTLAVALLVSLAWGVNEYQAAKHFRTALDVQHQRSLQGFAGHLDQLDTDLAKGAVAGSANQQVLYLGRVSSQSEAANHDLAQLPADQTGLSYVGQLLAQTAAFANSLSQRVAVGGAISAGEAKTLGDIHTRVIQVNRKVQDLLVRSNTENLAWTSTPARFSLAGIFGRTQVAEAAAEGQAGSAPRSVRNGLEQLDASLEKLPPLKYQGEYSTRSVAKPLGLPAGQVTRQQAQTVAQDFLTKAGYQGLVPVPAGETKGPLAAYTFTAKTAYLEVSRQGGVVLLFRDQRPIGTRTLSVAQGKSKAAAVLHAMHWNLALTSVQDDGSYIQLEAVSEENGIYYYPDKVRLMVALDNGQLVGYDATAYWAFHHTRSFPGPRVTLPEAEKKLPAGFSLTSTHLAVIPRPGNREVLCYELRGRYRGEEYLIYVDALNGKEEKIERVIYTPRGEFIQ